MGLVITLIIIGLVLVLAEILLVPGVGVAGILGLVSLGGSCFCAFNEFGNLAGGIVTGINAVLLVSLSVWVLRTKTWKRMSLETSIDAKAVDDEASWVSVGDTGVAITRLAPMGTVRFGDRTAEVKALEGMVDAGREVEIVIIEEGRIVVSPVNEIEE